jgi:hypothetical protein
MAKSISAHAPNSPSSAFCITRFSSFNKSICAPQLRKK